MAVWKRYKRVIVSAAAVLVTTVLGVSYQSLAGDSVSVVNSESVAATSTQHSSASVPRQTASASQSSPRKTGGITVPRKPVITLPTATGSQANRCKPRNSRSLRFLPVTELPREAHTTIARIAAHGPFPYRQDNTTFGNYERFLPERARGCYREYTVRTPGANNRGARRLVYNANGELYYTPDHYRTFFRVTFPKNSGIEGK